MHDTLVTCHYSILQNGASKVSSVSYVMGDKSRLSTSESVH